MRTSFWDTRDLLIVLLRLMAGVIRGDQTVVRIKALRDGTLAKLVRLFVSLTCCSSGSARQICTLWKHCVPATAPSKDADGNAMGAKPSRLDDRSVGSH